MNPIITPLSTVQSEKRDAAISQAQAFIDMLKNLGVNDESPYLSGITEILTEAFPSISSQANSWKIEVTEPEGGDEGDF